MEQSLQVRQPVRCLGDVMAMTDDSDAENDLDRPQCGCQGQSAAGAGAGVEPSYNTGELRSDRCRQRLMDAKI